MEVKLKNGESFESLFRRFKRMTQKEDIVGLCRRKQEFEPKSKLRQRKKADKLKKSRQTSKEDGR
jgi:ribosomal protein S21